MLLRKLWDEYELMHDLAASTVKHYRMTITAFGSWLGRAGRAGDLNDKTLSEFLRDQQLAGLASRTVESQRKDLLAIWRWAVAAGLHPGPGPDQVRRLKHSELIPSTWTPAEFRRYVDAAGLPRFNRYDRNGHHIGRSMRALALLSHDTGFRLGDLQQLPLAAVTNGGPLVIIQRKTGKAHSRRIYDETKRAVLATVPPQRQLAVGISRGQMWYWHKRICQAADVPQYRFARQ